MAVNYKNPPLMREDLVYDDWIKELEIWCSFTELTKARQGPAIFLTLKGKARETILAEVKPADLSKDTGVQLIITALDKLYVRNECDGAFIAYENFSKFKRPSQMSIKDYMIEFNLRLCKIRSHGMDLPDGVLAYYLLSCVNLSEEQSSLCRATCVNLTYKDMKTQIERVSTSSTLTNNSVSTGRDQITIDSQYVAEYDDAQYYYEEDYGEDEDKSHPVTEPQHNIDDAYYSQPSAWPGTSQQNQDFRGRKTQKNPLDEFGNPAPCRFCKSIYHWVDSCPDAPPSIRNSRGGRSHTYSRRMPRYPSRNRGRPFSGRGGYGQKQRQF